MLFVLRHWSAFPNWCVCVFDWQNNPVILRKQWNFDSTNATEILILAVGSIVVSIWIPWIRHYFDPNDQVFTTLRSRNKTCCWLWLSQNYCELTTLVAKWRARPSVWVWECEMEFIKRWIILYGQKNLFTHKTSIITIFPSEFCYSHIHHIHTHIRWYLRTFGCG